MFVLFEWFQIAERFVAAKRDTVEPRFEPGSNNRYH